MLYFLRRKDWTTWDVQDALAIRAKTDWRRFGTQAMLRTGLPRSIQAWALHCAKLAISARDAGATKPEVEAVLFRPVPSSWIVTEENLEARERQAKCERDNRNLNRGMALALGRLNKENEHGDPCHHWPIRPGRVPGRF